MTALESRPAQAAPVTVGMTETVTHEMTFTPTELARLLDIDTDQVAALLANVDHWAVTGPVVGVSPKVRS